MSSFRASEYGIEWPTDPTEIMQEALRDYVGDGDGADEAILDAHDTQVAARALRAAAHDLPPAPPGMASGPVRDWLVTRANRLERA